MPDQKTRADSLREYLTGATFDGGVQNLPNSSLGNYRSSIEALSLGVTIANAIANVSVLYAGGANSPGPGILTAVDANHLTWQPVGSSLAGSPVQFDNGIAQTKVLEGYNLPGQYLRITGTAPFVPGQSTITLTYLVNDVFAMDDVTPANASAGIYGFRATLVRNESTMPVTAFQRYLQTFGTQQVSNGSQLPAGGAGQITTTGSFADWPASGWCRIQTSGGSLREIVYYISRTSTSLNVLATGRALLATTSQAGAANDAVFAVPGIAIGINPAGAQSFGQNIQSIGNTQQPPSGVTWNTGITPATGLQIGTLLPNQQIGIWIWRVIPPGAIASPSLLSMILSNFNAF